MERTIFDKLFLDRIAKAYELIGNRLFASYRKNRLTNTDFSIISNNCWGGHVYRRFNLPYSSPTVGMYFFSEDYITFLKDLEYYLKYPIKMINIEDSRYKDVLIELNQGDIPIGVLGDNSEVELMFLHDNDPKEAAEKWTRRAKRVNFNNLIVKFSEMNNCEKHHVEAFNNLGFCKKVLLVANTYPSINDAITVKRYTKNGVVFDDTIWYSSFLNLTKLINR